MQTQRRYSRMYQRTLDCQQLRKSESTQDSWVASVSKWFADEKEDTGLQIAENSKCFGITSSIMSFSNESKELISQYQDHCGCPGCACEEMIKL